MRMNKKLAFGVIGSIVVALVVWRIMANDESEEFIAGLS
jgi:hypothetical protein